MGKGFHSAIYFFFSSLSLSIVPEQYVTDLPRVAELDGVTGVDLNDFAHT